MTCQVLDGIGRTLDPHLDLLSSFMHIMEHSRLHPHMTEKDPR